MVHLIGGWGAAEYEHVTWGETTVVQTKTPAPAGKPDDGRRQYAWHRHPALIAAIPAVFTLIGGVLTIVLGQNDVLPNAINPAPPPTTVLATSTVTATTTATSTVTETVTETPTQPGTTGPTGSTTPATPGALTITIKIGTGGKIGPTEWRAGSTPGAIADVFDDTGRQLDNGCYPTWTLKRGSTTVQSIRGTACQSHSFGMFNFGSDALKTPGNYRLSVVVVTDGGAKGTGATDFKVS